METGLGERTGWRSEGNLPRSRRDDSLSGSRAPARQAEDKKTRRRFDEYTDRDKCEEMASVALQSPTDADVGAWDKIFRYFNKTPRKLERGRQKGEVVAVKINLNNGGTRKKDNLCDAPPQTVLAVVRQLVNKTGVPEENVLVYDVERQFFSETSTPLWSEFPKIRILQDGGARREQPRNPAREIEGANWVEGVEFSAGRFREAKLVAKQVRDAEYLVNLATSKPARIRTIIWRTATKNQRRSRRSPRTAPGRFAASGELREYVDTKPKGTKNAYNPLVDLCASPSLGGKTLLCLLDGLYCGRKRRSYPQRFPNAPFNNKTIPYENPEQSLVSSRRSTKRRFKRSGSTSCTRNRKTTKNRPIATRRAFCSATPPTICFAKWRRLTTRRPEPFTVKGANRFKVSASSNTEITTNRADIRATSTRKTAKESSSFTFRWGALVKRKPFAAKV